MILPQSILQRAAARYDPLWSAGEHWAWMQRDLGKRSDKGRGARSKKKLGAHLATDRTALPTGERKDFDVVYMSRAGATSAQCRRGRRVQQRDIVWLRKRHSGRHFL